MAHVVGGFVVPHNPVMYFNPDGPDPQQKETVQAAYRTISDRIGELDATSALIIGCDHYILFGPTCLPRYVISTGDLEGPIDQLPGLKRGPIKANGPLGTHISEHGFANGFDYAVGRAMTVDHSIAVPHQLLLEPHPQISTVALMLACGVDPYLPLARAWELGQQIRRAIDAFDQDERVVVIGSGGISHWVGDENMGRVNPDFDAMILDALNNGDVDRLLGLSDEEITEQAGNGAMEIRTFLCAMGVCGAAGGSTVAYEAIPEWVTGMGLAELEVSGRA
ncbi:protocatechuate 3,4-dioxygenase [Haloglycomyces albus]|uniref:DODA-type extradiol aromatic ring-opening family dioxygenase n=1 Tax=Haloglycomyces albus TaxID=526067 RepID=UPI00046D8AFC|nr:protocatechuate 3,4-dioxygenase [Haloglycomyces albus]